ncbi:MAG: thiamine pyrophosphate-dependent enzyme [Candidatus Sumerlaeota bacterium]|nr:thiamine pyrophosphate-dependent enzyme [Candidatus Sumerlaeota bacterium]
MARERRQRAEAVARHGSIHAAVASGDLPPFADVSLSEALALGLLNQRVRKYVGVFGHGSTDLGEVLRVYEEAGAVRVFPVHSEIEASHAALALHWQYGETSAVFTSIGPGAMQALAGSLAALSNGAGVYYLLGDETTHDEGYNMQQIPRREQGLFLRLASALGPSYSLHTPEAVFTALRRGLVATRNPVHPSPFYLLMPMNTQPAILRDCNLSMLPSPASLPAAAPVCGDQAAFDAAIEAIQRCEKIVIKIGGGARGVGEELAALAERIDAVVVHGPKVPGVIPASHPRNMMVGGSKGSICGNYAMAEAELAVVIGAREVCQWDCSGVAWKNARQFINLNTDLQDATHYNRTIPIIGDAKANLRELLRRLDRAGVRKAGAAASPWLAACQARRAQWEAYRRKRYEVETLHDEAFGRRLLTQPAAIKIACDFADEIGAVKIFDASDVQANGFQIVDDERPGLTYTETGASYMGFAVSALLASAMADKPQYAIAFSGEGSFLMSPQILSDAVEHGARGMILVFDNRRMGAISGLQWAQYGCDFKTNDSVAVDYARVAGAFPGVLGLFGGTSRAELRAALRKAREHPSLSVVHIPVYCGQDELGGLGAWGQWNVGNWCEAVQSERLRLGL